MLRADFEQLVKDNEGIIFTYFIRTFKQTQKDIMQLTMQKVAGYSVDLNGKVVKLQYYKNDLESETEFKFSTSSESSTDFIIFDKDVSDYQQTVDIKNENYCYGYCWKNDTQFINYIKSFYNLENIRLLESIGRECKDIQYIADTHHIPVKDVMFKIQKELEENN